MSQNPEYKRESLFFLQSKVRVTSQPAAVEAEAGQCLWAEDAIVSMPTALASR